MRSHVSRLTRLLVARYRANPWLFVLQSTVLVAVGAFFIGKRNFWTPDTLFIALLTVAVVFGQTRAFLRRFLPFVALLLVYDSFRGIADDLNQHVHFWEMIQFDRAVFGGVLPTTTLQQWWWHGQVQWYDFYFYFLYTIHFAMPVLLGVVIWKKRDELYWPFVVSLLLLSFGAFVTYVVFPAAPPWLASNLGYIEPLHRISSDIWHAMGVTNFSELYAQLSPNAVAAMPSLHSAYPLLFTLFVWRLFGVRKTWWVLVYPVSIWVGVVYLGEHYVIDALAGALYAIAAYTATFAVMAPLGRYRQRFAKDYRRGYEYAYAKAVARKNQQPKKRA